MSWTDPCRGDCGGTRADCFCKELEQWLKEVEIEKQHYPLFRNRELDRAQLVELWKEPVGRGRTRTPIEALNDLSTRA